LNAPSILQQSIDPSDRAYLKRASLSSNSHYCCQCFRPFQHMHDLLSIDEIVVDIISFYVWIFIVMPFIILLLIVPATSIWIGNAIHAAQMDNQEGVTHGVRRFHLHEDEIIVDDLQEPEGETEEAGGDE